MKQWWKRNSDHIPKRYETAEEVEAFKSEVEDLTGSIPLLLRKCVPNGEIELAQGLEEVYENVQNFMTDLRGKEKEKVLEK
jgi:hypothetical protein